MQLLRQVPCNHLTRGRKLGICVSGRSAVVISTCEALRIDGSNDFQTRTLQNICDKLTESPFFSIG